MREYGDGYFLIVQDFINWGKNRGIVFGPGKWFGGWEHHCICTEYHRFRSAQIRLALRAISQPRSYLMPDITVDIQDARRDEVIQYCAGQIRRGPRQQHRDFWQNVRRMAVRDVARVLTSSVC